MKDSECLPESITIEKHPLISIVMGSDSDWKTMKDAANVCAEFDIEFEAKVISAHRTPKDMCEYSSKAIGRGIKVIIAGAGGAAHLPGMIASQTTLPVIGVPIRTSELNGMDSLLSILQMPKGVPVATVAIGCARNAGILAASILSTFKEDIRQSLKLFKERMAAESRIKTANLK